MSTPYGADGCRCWFRDWEDGREEGDFSWEPNAHCPYHGILPRERMETGEYRVYTGPCERHPGASTIGGLCAMCSRRPDALWQTTPAPVEPNPCPDGECLGSWDCPRECPAPEADDVEPGTDDVDYDDCRGGMEDWMFCACTESEGGCKEREYNACVITEQKKERGVFAAVRRWVRRLGDWLDPHAAHRREYADFRSEWGQQRADLDGREPRDQGRQR